MAKKKISQASVNPDQDWQSSEDADRVKRYAKLTMDNKRYTAAKRYISSEQKALSRLTGDGGGIKPRALARKGRRKSVRVRGRK